MFSTHPPYFDTHMHICTHSLNNSLTHCAHVRALQSEEVMSAISANGFVALESLLDAGPPSPPSMSTLSLSLSLSTLCLSVCLSVCLSAREPLVLGAAPTVS